MTPGDVVWVDVEGEYTRAGLGAQRIAPPPRRSNNLGPDGAKALSGAAVGTWQGGSGAAGRKPRPNPYAVRRVRPTPYA